MTEEKRFHGWITKDGVFHRCEFWEHILKKRRMIRDGIDVRNMLRLEDVGVIQVTYEYTGGYGIITKKQREKLFDLCTEMGYNFDEISSGLEYYF